MGKLSSDERDSVYGSNGYQSVPRIDLEVCQNEKNPLNGAKRSRTLSACCAFTAVVVAALCAAAAVASWSMYRQHRREEWIKRHPDADVPFELVTHPSPPPPELWGSMQRPFPTGAFWLNAGVEQGDSPVVAYPYALSFAQEAFHVSYSASRRYSTPKAIADIFASDLKLSTHEVPVRHEIAGYDSFSLVEKYTTAAGSYKVYVVKGAPFVTVEYEGCTPILTPLAMFNAINESQPSAYKNQVSGTHFKMETSSGQTWAMFSSSKITFNFNNVQMWMSEPFTGTLRLALVPDPADEVLLARHSGAFPTGGVVSYTVEEDAVDMTYTWTRKGKGELLMLALPHHMDVMVDARPAVMAGAFRCIKGAMTALRGDRWLLRDTLTTISWQAPTPIDPERAEDVRNAAAFDVLGVPPIAPDPYGFGKQIGRHSRLALIADSVGDNVTRDNALCIVRNGLVPWLEGTNPDTLLYDTTWGGIVTKNGLDNDHDDFGNGYYNDHHFHYGYFVYSAAVLVKYDPSFYDSYKSQLDFWIQDIANEDPSSRHFPLARHKDFYDWHSWASGAFSQGNGKSQESVSEAVQAYYAVYLFGVATENQRLAKWGRILLQMEIRSARMYWQMPAGNPVYDTAFSANRMAGLVGALDVVANTWFGNNLEFVHGINMMPFLPISEELLRPEYVAQEYPVLASIFSREDQPQDQWAAFAYLDRAIVEAAAAWEQVHTIRTFDGGNSLANSLWWIATRPAAGVNMTDPFAAAGTGEPECAANSACAVLGLLGLCCPTAEGMQLGCCPALPAVAKLEEEGSTTTTAADDNDNLGGGIDSATAPEAMASMVAFVP